jgi:ribosomal-protein-alanine N-acetyltransferase
MRAMTLADVDRVLHIEQTVQAYPWTCGNFTDALSHDYECHVYEQDDEIQAYVVLMPVLDEAELLNIAVAAGQQRKGLGRLMLHEMLTAARQHKTQRVFLEVRPSNIAAIALYRSMGFAEIGVRRDYYQNAQGHEDALMMACDLTVS